MTSTIAAPETKPELDPLRLLPITANLLPAEITDARRARKIKRVIAAVLVVVIAGIAGWDFYARQQTSTAQDGLTTVQNQVLQLQKQQKSYSALTNSKTAAQAITAELALLMSQDLQWSNLLPALRASAPAGVSLSNVSGSLKVDGAAAGASSVPGSSSVDAIGSITLTGTAPDKDRIAGFVDALAKVTGLANPFLTATAVQSGGSQLFTVQVEITRAALGGRYAPVSASPSASASASATTGGH